MAAVVDADKEIKRSMDHDDTYSAMIWFPSGVIVPSLNHLYKPGIKAGRFPYLYKDERVLKFQEQLIELGEHTDLVRMRGVPYFSLDLSLVFFIRDRFWRRDCSNLVKATEDGIVKIIGIDDSRIIHLEASKERKKDKIEGIRISIHGHFAE